jgi:peptide/nickel transport system permease protein
MIERFFKSRGVNKFRRNKMALVALGVIMVYFFVALLVLFGAIKLDDTKERVTTNRAYGFLQHPDLEERFNDLDWIVTKHLAGGFTQSGGILEAANPDVALESLAMAERRIADLPLEQLATLWTELQEAQSALDDLWLDSDREGYVYDIIDLKDEIKELEDPAEIEAAQQELSELRDELVSVDAAIAAAMDIVDAKLGELMPIPQGLDGLKYKFRTFLGSDTSGRSISIQAFYSIKIAFQIGFVAAITSVAIGTLLGAAAGFFGGWVDHLVMWIVATLSSVPYLVLLVVIAYMFRGSSLFDNASEHPALALVPVYAAFCLTFWISTCRVIRGEVMKIKELEYVQAATSIGFGRFYILVRHVIPNTTHLMFINFSLIFIGAIKSEVILSFLGLGVKGQPSWGIMISLGREDVQNFFFWSVLTATALMFGLVLAFNIVSDALQDAFDPKHVS